MPPRRRSGHTSASNHASTQGTLNFGSKSRISKPTQKPLDAKKAHEKTDLLRSKLSASPAPAPTPVHEIAESTSTSTSLTTEPEQQPAPGSLRSEHVVREQAKVELRVPASEEDVKAAKITDADIKRYWEAEERKRLTPRVHQEDVRMEEKILRHFDLSNQYGPCIGIARIKRWRRANALGLKPPIEVLALLLKEEAKGTANEKAYIDELLS